MKRSLTAAQMKELDRWAIEEIGIPAICLMENAGRLVADEAAKVLPRAQGGLWVVCGTGNNGGDGFVAARHLLNRGFQPRILLVGRRSALTDDAMVHYLAAQNLKIPIVGPEQKYMTALKRADVIVDALWGVGLSRNVSGVPGEVICAINASRAHVIAVDVPSGLDATTGDIRGLAVKAHVTVALACAKTGFFRKKGPGCAGKVRVVDIGIPYGCFSDR